MTEKLYSVKDELAGVCLPPVPQKNDDVAIRTFYQSMKQNDSVADFNLYFVGTFDSEAGILEPCIPPRIIDTNEAKKKIMAGFAQNKPLFTKEDMNEEKSI
ncbi:nonstructural protein [Dipodfec virus UOA04_Rod_1057]|nr:nonstructural protein [Dipodfec virus UOA04_Rod_1057]